MRRLLVLVAMALGVSGFTCGGDDDDELDDRPWYQRAQADAVCLENVCRDEMIVVFEQAEAFEPGVYLFELTRADGDSVACELELPAGADEAPGACDDDRWFASAERVCPAQTGCDSGSGRHSITFASVGDTPAAFDVRLRGPSGSEHRVEAIEPNYKLYDWCHSCRSATVFVPLP